MANLSEYIGFYGSLNSSDELDAVNSILSCIGEQGVNALDDTSDTDVINARRILYEENLRIQSQGWAFNTEESVSLSPDAYSGYIKYLSTYLRVLSPSSSTIYINRNGNVYDTSAKTDRFEDDISVNMIIARKLSEMPYCFREYIVASAAQRFNQSYFGDEGINQDLQQRKQLAYIDCNTYDLDFSYLTYMDNSNISDIASR